jgi:hypothetical protein
LQGLLVKIPDQRLGGGPGDAADVRRHLFFSDINWEKLERREVCVDADVFGSPVSTHA